MRIRSENVDTTQPKSSNPMRFQERDGELLQTIYEHDGVMARRQVQGLFWQDKSVRAMEKRLAKLHQMAYLAWPTLEQRRTRPIPEPVVWLGWKGIIWIAGQSGVSIKRPTSENENQMRRLHKELHERGFHWFREPHWAQLKHDLAVVDFRLSVEKAAKQNPYFCLEEWVNESTFRAKPDIVEYDWRTNGPIQRVHKRVIPDGYFALIAKGQLHQGAAARLRFLLEMDLSSHDNPSFGKEKVLPGIAYILSHTYRGRFGDNSGRWLIVTTGKRRLLNLKHQTEVEGGRNASVFYLTTLDQIQPDTMLSTPIWYRGGDTDRHRFIEPPLTAQRSQENHHS